MRTIWLALVLSFVPALVSAQEVTATVTTDSGAGWQKKGTKSVSFGLPAGGGGSAAIAYFLDENTAIDLDFEAGGIFRFTKSENADTGGSDSNLQLGLTLGYKMYRLRQGDTSMFFEPAVHLGSSTQGDFGTNFHIGAGVVAGVEHKFAERFSIQGAVGVDLDFSNSFKNIDFGTFSTGLFATFYID